MGSPLTLDHVNYLIWRHLQEQGYGKTAIQLQREWKISDPQSLPFTDAVKPFVLLHMLQDALAYDDLVVDAVQTQHDVPPIAETSHIELEASTQASREKRYSSLARHYGFVGFKLRRPSTRPEEVAGHFDDSNGRIKRPRIDASQSRRKPSRLSGSNAEQHRNGEAMDLDDYENLQDPRDVTMDELPIKDEPPLVYTLDVGQSIGVQPEEEKPDEKLVAALATHSIPGADVFGLKWNEQTDKLTVSGGCAWHAIDVKQEEYTNGDQPDNEESGQSVHKPDASINCEALYSNVESKKAVKFAVSQFEHATTSTGQQLFAQAIEELDENGLSSGTILLSSDTGSHDIELEKPPTTVIALRFDANAKHLLAVWQSNYSSADGDTGGQSFIRVWDLESLIPVANIASDQLVRDVAWLRDESFMVCGDKMLDLFTTSEGGSGFEFQRAIETDHSWDQIRYDAKTQQLACISIDDGTFGLLHVQTEQFLLQQAHEDILTAICWQPCPPLTKTEPDNDQPEITATKPQATPRILATSSMDGTVKLWDTNQTTECIHTYTTEKPQPVWTIDFSPDGGHLAAIGENMLTVWSAQVEREVVARWVEPPIEEREPLPTDQKLNGEHDMPIVNGHSHDDPRGNDNSDITMADDIRAEDGLSPLYCLAWARDSKKLAVALGNKVSIIELPDT